MSLLSVVIAHFGAPSFAEGHRASLEARPWVAISSAGDKQKGCQPPFPSNCQGR